MSYCYKFDRGISELLNEKGFPWVNLTFCQNKLAGVVFKRGWGNFRLRGETYPSHQI